MHTRFAALFLGFALVPFAWPLPSAAQIAIIPGSAERGAALIKSKGCLDCHSFDGSGQGRSPAQLAADVWNHSPEMWRAQQTKNVRPLMDSIETADVFAYFFSLAYFKAAGNANSGRNVFEAKGCAQCHDTSVAGRRAGPPISTWSEVNDPLAWAERM